MDLRQMKYFLAVAEERSFGRAAERLHMAQPPLTRQIRAIEASLGVRLFVRGPKGVELTEAGKALLEEVPNILAMARRAEEKVQSASLGLAGRLDIGIFGSSVLNVIPLLLKRFHDQRPDVKLSLHSLTKVEQLDALRERRILVGFNRLVPSESDIDVEVVLREKLVVGLNEQHPLCAKDEISIRDMDNEPMILYPNVSLPGLMESVCSAFRREESRIRIEQMVEDVLTCVALVSAGFGLCITTQSATNLRLPGIVYRPLKSRYLSDIELSCMYRHEDPSPVLSAFLDVVREFAESYNQETGTVARAVPVGTKRWG
ncbi:LysR substrate-binding domain-containing protein [Burkholderia sp. GS2Y]|uniref:LysR substrate-binding domain-containing protein n=1 Tax=Burkholderia theae TaxID=3143496 RepID=A0ABU9WJB6_9BURK